MKTLRGIGLFCIASLIFFDAVFSDFNSNTLLAIILITLLMCFGELCGIHDELKKQKN